MTQNPESSSAATVVGNTDDERTNGDGSSSTEDFRVPSVERQRVTGQKRRMVYDEGTASLQEAPFVVLACNNFQVTNEQLQLRAEEDQRFAEQEQRRIVRRTSETPGIPTSVARAERDNNTVNEHTETTRQSNAVVVENVPVAQQAPSVAAPSPAVPVAAVPQRALEDSISVLNGTNVALTSRLAAVVDILDALREQELVTKSKMAEYQHEFDKMVIANEIGRGTVGEFFRTMVERRREKEI